MSPVAENMTHYRGHSRDDRDGLFTQPQTDHRSSASGAHKSTRRLIIRITLRLEVAHRVVRLWAANVRYWVYCVGTPRPLPSRLLS